MRFEEIKALDREYMLQTYTRCDVALDHGYGATLRDTEGRAYIDFGAGIGVSSLGYGNETWAKAIYEQALKLGHSSNLFYNGPCERLAARLVSAADMAGVFFANSGAEAVEGAIKTARKYSFDKYSPGRTTVLTLQHSFHGRTLAALAATGQDRLHRFFFPFPEGFRYAPANDRAGLEEVAGDDVCAVMMEPIQGEGGVLPLEKGYVRAVADLCAQQDWLLIMDEVQSGIGRTGTLFAFQQFGVRPDIVTFAKGIAGGLPMGGFLVGKSCREVLHSGEHGSTFGGNPIAAAAANVVLDTLTENFLAEVRAKGQYLRDRIAGFQSSHISGVRGLGLMIGADVQGLSHRELRDRLLSAGLITLTAGEDTLRLLPPLVITRAELDRGLEIMEKVLRDLDT